MAPLASVQELLDGVEARSRSHASADRPFVTVSWAQGIDGSMAHAPEASRERLMLSGSASMAMTHGLRALHEGILVGRGTVSGDDPRLTVRFAGSGEALEAGAAPLPPTAVVLDGALRTPLDCDLLRQAAGGRRVCVVAGGDVRAPALLRRGDDPAAAKWDAATSARCEALLGRGAVVLVVAPARAGTTDVDVAASLAAVSTLLGVASVFVEGGASVVDALLRRPEVVDEVVVTIAPVFVGGLRPGSSPLGPMRLTGVQTLALGDDVVVRGAPS